MIVVIQNLSANAVVIGLEVFGHILLSFISRLLNDADRDDDVEISRSISSPEVLFKTCITMKFVDDDDDVTYDEVLS